MNAETKSKPAATTLLAAGRLDRFDWQDTAESLDEQGFAILENLLTARTCRDIAAHYADDERFRSHIRMARHGFGQGEYKYFRYPLPDPIDALRTDFYAHLAPIANRWHGRLGIDLRYPGRHAAYLKKCHDAGQSRPTPLLSSRPSAPRSRAPNGAPRQRSGRRSTATSRRF